LKNKLAGKFIVLDGSDGCGKSTQVKLLAKWIAEQEIETECLRDPGDTAIGEKIRQILLNPEHTAMDTRTELLLYMAARAQLWAEKIDPALKANKCVIIDRWLSSTCAYQGFAGGYKIRNVIEIAKGCLERSWPDLTIILDVDPETSSKRLKGIPDRMEEKPSEYHKKVRQGFWELTQKLDSSVFVEAGGNIETVHKKITEVIKKRFE